MKKLTIATFVSPTDAETAITRLQQELNVPSDAISSIYRTDEIAPDEVIHDHEDEDGTMQRDILVKEGAGEGAVVGGSLGALAGLATFLGMIPVIGPIFAAGPIVAALGIGAGVVGTTAAGALTGATAGGLVGALTALGINDKKVSAYQEEVNMGNILLLVHKDNPSITDLLNDAGATEVDSFVTTV